MDELRRTLSRLVQSCGFWGASLLFIVAIIAGVILFAARMCARVLIYFFSLALTFYIFDIFGVSLLRDLLIFVTK